MNNTNSLQRQDVDLPIIEETMLPHVKGIIEALDVPRDVIATDEEIIYAWRGLPRELRAIPNELRDELIARACIATSVGLFDGTINYVWNASIKNLRKKVKDFGFNVVSHILNDSFDEEKLNDLKDTELLTLCLKLNLISEEGFYFLNQCRDIRNNFSAAHPSMGFIDDRELIVYVSRCAKYALSDITNPKGVDINQFISAIKGKKFTQPQLETWIERLKNTHDAQRELLFGMLHGIYCDPASNEEARINSISVCIKFVSEFTPAIKSNILDRHYEYQAKGDSKRYLASQKFFEKIGLLTLLNNLEIHNIFSDACKKLLSVHYSFDNFYNEPPFAERLSELSQQNAVPESAKNEYVISVITCYVGNNYGISRAAIQYYEKMIKNFSPKEVEILFNIRKMNTTVANRIEAYPQCNTRYKYAIELLDEESIPTKLKTKYNRIIHN